MVTVAASEVRPRGLTAGTGPESNSAVRSPDARAGNSGRPGGMGTITPETVVELCAILRNSALEGRRYSIAGSSENLRAEQICCGGTVIDMSRLHRLRAFDCGEGVIEMEAGTSWRELSSMIGAIQHGKEFQWVLGDASRFPQSFTIGGTISAGLCGGGLHRGKIISDIESFTLVDSAGNLRECSRSLNSALFNMVAVGYGLVGPVASVRLRLVPQLIQRKRQGIRSLARLIASLAERVTACSELEPARREQGSVLPEFARSASEMERFFALKVRYDPGLVFQNEMYRKLKREFELSLFSVEY